MGRTQTHQSYGAYQNLRGLGYLSTLAFVTNSSILSFVAKSTPNSTCLPNHSASPPSSMVRNLSDVATLPGYIEPPSKFPRETEEEDLEDDDEEPLVNDLDTGALVNELMRRDLMPKKVDLNPHEKKCAVNNPESLIWKFSAVEEPASEQEVSYRGTQLALTKVYDLIEQR